MLRKGANKFRGPHDAAIGARAVDRECVRHSFSCLALWKSISPRRGDAR